MILEKLTADTCQLLRKWRNHNRNYFVDVHLITHKEQEEWFRKYLLNTKLWLFIVYHKEVPVGSIGFSIVADDEAQIELLMLGEPEQERKGIMSEALTEMMRIFPYKKYRLLVLKSNLKAIEFYKKNGFAMDKEDEKCYIMTKYT